jgi:protein-L-isoaspartate(D-aspartate) O-methyltransferase
LVDCGRRLAAVSDQVTREGEGGRKPWFPVAPASILFADLLSSRRLVLGYAWARRLGVPKQPPGDDNVGRMQFLLALRKRGISDPAVLRAMDQVPREHFVESSFIESAYADQALPIACGQTISQPYVVAYMTEQLQVQSQQVVLEVGTGSGYQAAILSRLAREVITVERYRTLAETARIRLATLGYNNVEVRVGDGLTGVPERAPFDRIMITAAAESIPDDLVAQLADNGVMVLPVGPHSGSQQLVKLTKKHTRLEQENLIGVRFVPLLRGKAREL